MVENTACVMKNWHFLLDCCNILPSDNLWTR